MSPPPRWPEVRRSAEAETRAHRRLEHLWSRFAGGSPLCIHWGDLLDPERNVFLAQRIRERSRELGLSDAEVARRAGLSERRYGYYATGEREPNLATLIRICEVLAASPNDLLLSEGKPPPRSTRDRLLARIAAATTNLSVSDLELAACQIECVSARRGVSRARGRRVGAIT